MAQPCNFSSVLCGGAALWNKIPVSGEPLYCLSSRCDVFLVRKCVFANCMCMHVTIYVHDYSGVITTLGRYAKVAVVNKRSQVLIDVHSYMYIHLPSMYILHENPQWGVYSVHLC